MQSLFNFNVYRNDCCFSFFSTAALKCTWEVNKVHKNKLRKEKAFFRFSVKDLLVLVKTVRIQDLHTFTCYFSRKKSFMQHPQFLLHKRHLSEHSRKS